jgi:decaprenyl-phosphate phosphoribosyltransferase
MQFPSTIDLVRLARPSHWIKNVFILIPIPFAIAAGAHLDWRALLFGISGFCLITSAIYILNDLIDVDHDRLHEVKRNRPIASRKVSTEVAVGLAIPLFALGLILALAAKRFGVMLLIAAYILINVGYCLGLKKLPLIDALLLSSGYVVRVLLGCRLVEAVPSNWLLLCTSSIALFLTLAKRRADLISPASEKYRASLGGYNLQFLDQAMTLMAGVTMLGYALYSIEAKVFVQGRELAALPFVVFGILNYLRLAYTQSIGGFPVDLAFRSPSFQLCAVGWALAIAWSLGWWG